MIPPNRNGYSAAQRQFRGVSQTQQFTRGGNPSGINPVDLQLETQPPNIHIYNMAGGIVNINLHTPRMQQPDVVRRNRNLAIPEQPMTNQNQIRTFNALPPQNETHSQVTSPGSSSSCGSDCTFCNSLGSDEPRTFRQNVETFGHPTSPFQEVPRSPQHPQ